MAMEIGIGNEREQYWKKVFLYLSPLIVPFPLCSHSASTFVLSFCLYICALILPLLLSSYFALAFILIVPLHLSSHCVIVFFPRVAMAFLSSETV